MPLFDYICSECNYSVELLQKHNEPVPDTCPSCGKRQTLGKRIGITSFQLKGGGWYRDGYTSTKKTNPKN